MELDKITKDISAILDKRKEILFGYIHGSIHSSDNPRDVDVAVFLDPGHYAKLIDTGEVSIGYAIPLEMKLEQAIGKKVDVQVMNGAPLGFQYQVINSGTLVTDRDSDIRADFECLTRVQYFDFRPRMQEYLREITT